ncbi:putative WRKY transcription factor 19 [Morella rubra]|uniref:Putative WRKY transcription factor 19 n=1 Tax=Morella rubra TaxID=262757 RepID=A0A6A1UKM7_9ROSI|nr:putative WRKY transcription factor 19 [Morella rubra]
MPTIELRLMKWFGFPFLSLPMDFNADNLVELNMRGSSIKQLWKGNKVATNLSSMECLEELYAVGTTITQFFLNPFPRSIKTLRITGSQLPLNRSLMVSIIPRYSGLVPLPMTSPTGHLKVCTDPFVLIITLVHDFDNNRKWIGYSMFIDYKVIQLPGEIQRYPDYRELIRNAYNWVPDYEEDDALLNGVMFKWMLRRNGEVPDLQSIQGLHFFAPGIVGMNEGEFGLIYQLSGL